MQTDTGTNQFSLTPWEGKQKKMPSERVGITTKLEVNGVTGRLEVYMTSNAYPDTQNLGEIFLVAAKEGSTISGLLDGFAIAVSWGLQHGAPVEPLIEKLIGQHFEPSDENHKSIVDAIAKYLKKKYIDEQRAEGIQEQLEFSA